MLVKFQLAWRNFAQDWILLQFPFCESLKDPRDCCWSWKQLQEHLYSWIRLPFAFCPCSPPVEPRNIRVGQEKVQPRLCIHVCYVRHTENFTDNFLIVCSLMRSHYTGELWSNIHPEKWEAVRLFLIQVHMNQILDLASPLKGSWRTV